MQYLLEDVDFSAVPADRRKINFGVHAHPSAEVLPVFIAKDNSLDGYRSLVSKYLNGFALEGCVKMDKMWDDAFGCPFSIRRLNIWSKKGLGPLKLEGPGYNVAAVYGKPTEGQNAGNLFYAQNYNGYGGLVIPGKSYTISAKFSGDAYVDFSDWYVPAFFGEAEEAVHLKTSHGECDVNASQAHGLFYGRFGPVRGAAEYCREAFNFTCHTVVKGDSCLRDVQWAMSWGIKAYPHKFPGLTEDSTLEEVQMHYYRTYQADCPEPCPPSTLVGASLPPSLRR